MMRTLLSATILLVITPCLSAQAEVEERNELKKKRIDSRIQAMREAISRGRPITTNVRVTVRLRNESKLKGVVKNGRFVEKLNGLDFVETDLKTPGAGIRVWYYDNTVSYIFLPFEAITSYKIGAQLTEVEIQEIEERITKKAEEDAKRQLAARQRKAQEKAQEAADAEKPDIPGTFDGNETAENGGGEEGEKVTYALLEEFPPEDGWGEEKLREIERRKIVIGAFPDEKARRFLEVFSEWEGELRQREENEESPATPPGSGVPAVPDGAKPPKYD